MQTSHSFLCKLTMQLQNFSVQLPCTAFWGFHMVFVIELEEVSATLGIAVNRQRIHFSLIPTTPMKNNLLGTSRTQWSISNFQKPHMSTNFTQTGRKKPPQTNELLGLKMLFAEHFVGSKHINRIPRRSQGNSGIELFVCFESH